MSKGYILFTEEIHDREALDAYTMAAVPSVIAAGGRAVIAGPPAQVPEGHWHGHTTVVLEFDSVDAARAWYHGAAYQAVIGQRHGAATSNVAIFAGFELPPGRTPA
jgi:uncharacterized protein (DUF1330 family)